MNQKTVSGDKPKLVWIDIMKGILILLMVLGHTYVAYKEFIYLFHMAVFFMISGYCWSEKHSHDARSIGKYIVQRIVRLYVPFVLINVTFILLNNIFITTGIYSNSTEFIVLTNGTPVKQYLAEYYSVSHVVKAIIRTLCFAGGSAKLCGATWFLSTLFVMSVFHCIMSWIIEKLKLKKEVVFSIIIVLCLIWAWIVDIGVVKTIGAIDRFPSAYSAYLGGVLIKLLEKNPNWKKKSHTDKPVTVLLSMVASMAVLIVFYLIGFHIELASSKITNPFGYALVSICGWVLIKGIAVFLSKNKASVKMLGYLGSRTIPILLFHTLSFKIVSLIYLNISRGNMLLLASYPVIFNTYEWLKYIYLLVGIAIPLIIYEPYYRGKVFLKQKLEKAKGR